jgi:hypothetical protein
VRNIKGVDEKYKDDWVWLLWKLIFNEINNRDDINLHKYIKYLYELYKFQFKTGKKEKKKYYIYMTFYCIVSSPDYNKSIIMKPHIDIQINLNINLLYQTVDNYLVATNGCPTLDKKEYLERILKKYHEYIEKKNSKIKTKRLKEEIKINKEEVGDTCKLSYLDDLMYFKRTIKNKDVLKYFDEEDDKKKIIYL